MTDPIRERHYEATAQWEGQPKRGLGWCWHCGQGNPFPCDAIRAADERDAARADAERLYKALRNVDHCHPMYCERCGSEVTCEPKLDEAIAAVRAHEKIASTVPEREGLRQP